MILFTIAMLIISVYIGGFLVQSLKEKQNGQLIKLLLAFSGGFLLSIGFIHFIPELYEEAESSIGYFILIGFLIQLLLEYFSGGIEHGHVHHHGHGKFPLAILLALCAHAFLEGIPLGGQLSGHHLATTHEHGNDHTLLIGIVTHRIPVAIALTTLLIASGVQKFKLWLALTAFALISPLGLWIGMQEFNFKEIDINALLAVVVGMFLHISTTIIFETSENHKFNFLKLFTIMAGACLAIAIH